MRAQTHTAYRIFKVGITIILELSLSIYVFVFSEKWFYIKKLLGNNSSKLEIYTHIFEIVLHYNKKILVIQVSLTTTK